MSEVDEKGTHNVSTPEDDLSPTEGTEGVRTPHTLEGAISNPTPEDEGLPVSNRVSNAEVVTHSDEKPETSHDGDADTFPRSYVEELRTENGTYRNRAKDAEAKADELAQALWTERVRSLGVLADPTDLPYDPEALEDLDLIRSQADELLSSKPLLRTRQITERVGQGERGAETISLVELLQRGA